MTLANPATSLPTYPEQPEPLEGEQQGRGDGRRDGPATARRKAPRHRTTAGRATVVDRASEPERLGGLNRNTYMTVTATLLLAVAIAHLLRIILGWQVEIGGLSIPFWVSWLAVLAAGALAYFGFTLKR